MTREKIVLAYSGGLDTSVILKWLIENYQADIVAYAANIGQDDDPEWIKKRALATGAKEVHVLNLVDEFVSDYVFPMLRAGAVYEGQYLLGTSIARPLIAKAQVDIAHQTGATTVSHGATGKGNDQVRFELTFAALDPTLKVIAPWRIWDLDSRTKLLEYAAKHGIEVPVTAEKPYSVDQNLLHTSYEGGVLEDPWNSAKADMFLTTKSPQDAPDKGDEVLIRFEEGNPVAINNEVLSPAALLEQLNQIGGLHGIGRVDICENRFVGMKSRGVYETPGGTIIQFARKQLETIALDREVHRLREQLMPQYAEMVYYGFWFAPERLALQRFFDDTARTLTGEIKIALYKGNLTTLGRRSPNSLYSTKIASFEEGGGYRQADAEGFIRLQGLRLRIGALLRQKQEGKA